MKLRREKAHLENIVAERTQQLREASLTDPLTGLRNRRFIQEVLQDDIVAFIDLKIICCMPRTNEKPALRLPCSVILLIDIDFSRK